MQRRPRQRRRTEYSTGWHVDSSINVHIIPRLGSRKLNSVTPIVVERFLDQLETHGVGKADLGLGTAIMTSIQLCTRGVRPTDAGVASAPVIASQQIGGAVGAALLNAVAASHTASYAQSHLADERTRATLASLTHGYTTAFWWAAALLVLAVVLAAVLVNAEKPRAGSRVAASGGGGTQAEAGQAPIAIH